MNEQIINSITSVVKANGKQGITGTNLQGVLVAMVQSLGAFPSFAGIATPSTTPTTSDANVFYLAYEAGEYSGFGVTLDGETYNIIRRTSQGWESLNTNIKTDKAIAEAIASALEGYSTTAQVTEAIVNALQPYITKTESAQAIIDALEPYAKISEVATAITAALQPYATTEAVNQALEPYATTEEVAEALQPYAKTEDVEQAIEESKTDLTDVELVAAAALNDLNERVNALLGSDELATLIDGKIEELRISLTDIIDTLRKAVIDNELVTAAALNDLNSRI